MELVGLGWPFEEWTVGRRFKTIGRTVTDADITNFINAIGLTETYFMDLEAIREESVFGRRFAPAALCYGFAEALIAQATLQRTGLAMLRLEMDIKNPVFAGDTIHAEVEVVEARHSKSRPDAGIVRTQNHIVKQDGTICFVYSPVRMIRARAAAKA